MINHTIRSTRALVLFVLVASLAFSLTGCAGSGVGAQYGDETSLSSLSSEDLGAVEAALITDRLAASAEAPVVSASLLSDVSAQAAAFGRGGRQYHGGTSGAGMGGSAWRGTGNCPVTLEGTLATPTRLLIASQACQVTRLENGALQITLGTGNLITLVPPVDGATVTTVTVNGIAWEATFGTTAAEPLVILRNPVSNRLLTIQESDDGALTITPSGGRANRGRWASDGALELTDDGIGRGYRYRGGRWS